MRHLHIWLMIAIMIACFIWMLLAAMLIGKPGGDGDVNAIAIIHGNLWIRGRLAKK